MHTSIVDVIVEGRLLDDVSNVSRKPFWRGSCTTDKHLGEVSESKGEHELAGQKAGAQPLSRGRSLEHIIPCNSSAYLHHISWYKAYQGNA